MVLYFYCVHQVSLTHFKWGCHISDVLHGEFLLRSDKLSERKVIFILVPFAFFLLLPERGVGLRVCGCCAESLR